jgi:hypothetical protein
MMKKRIIIYLCYTSRAVRLSSKNFFHLKYKGKIEIHRKIVRIFIREIIVVSISRKYHWFTSPQDSLTWFYILFNMHTLHTAANKKESIDNLTIRS